jgi:hypothetical protein
MAAHVGALEGLFAGRCSRSRLLSVHGAQDASACALLAFPASFCPGFARVCSAKSSVVSSQSSASPAPARARTVMLLRHTRSYVQASWARATTSRLRTQRRPWPSLLNNSCKGTGCKNSVVSCSFFSVLFYLRADAVAGVCP